MTCDGAVESWLGCLHHALQSTLKEGLLTAVQLSSSLMAGAQSPQEHSGQSQFALYLQQLCSKSNQTNSELMLLAAQIELASQLRSSIDDFKQGNKSSLAGLLTCLNTGLQCCVTVLKESPSVCERTGSHTSTVEAVSHNVTQSQLSQAAVASPSLKKEQVLDSTTMNKIGFVHRTQSLILILNHYQRVVQDLTESGLLSSVSGHCMEYIFHPDDISLSLYVGNHDLLYGFELQGATKRLVVTPLTERYFVHLVAAASSGVCSLCLGNEVRVLWWFCMSRCLIFFWVRV